MSASNYYKVGGSLNHNHHTYVTREADIKLLELLKSGEYCFILNSRQMGKSSLRVRTGKILRSSGFKCAFIDLTMIGSHVSSDNWYKGISYQLLDSLELDLELNFNQWWQQHDYLTEPQRLYYLIKSVVLEQISKNIIIFLDEIDSLIEIEFKDDFFALIRACYNQRAENADFNRLTFCLLGVASPADLIQDSKRTPFNIGRSIKLTGFTFAEAKDALIPGLQACLNYPEEVLQQILSWTGGQPFLTQKVCNIIVQYAEANITDIQPIIEKYLIENWESQDEPEHLRTIRDRILADETQAIRILGLYQQILNQSVVFNTDTLKGAAIQTKPAYAGLVESSDDEEIQLRLSGLIVRKNHFLQVYNPIYAQVFNHHWINQQLYNLRPYSDSINKWLKTQRGTASLLQGQSLTDALSWAGNKRLSDEDYQFLAASQAEQDRQKNQILTQANQQAKQIIRKGIIILSFTSLIAVILPLIASIYAQKQIKTAQETTILEKSGVKALQEFESQQIEGLILAIKAGQDLKELSNNQRDVANYPTNSPVSALVNILNNISEENQLKGHKNAVRVVDFSPDNQIIASGSDDGTIKIWQRNGVFIKTLNQGGKVYGVSFSPDGKIIAAGSDNGTIKIWTLEGKSLKIFKDNTIYTLSFSPDGKIIATAGRDGKVKLWNVNGSLIKTLTGHQGSVYTVNFSPNGKIIASGSNDGTIKLWKLDGSLIKTLTGHQGSVYTVNFSPNGKIIASGSKDNTVNLWQLDGKLITTLTGHQNEVNSVAFSPNGKMIASGSADTTIKLWEVNGKLIKTLKGHSDSIWNVRFSPDGKTIASASLDRSVRLWKLQLPPNQIQAHQKLVPSVNISSDGKIATASFDQTIKIWKPDGTLIKTIPLIEALATNLSFSPDSKNVVAVINDSLIKVFKEDGTSRNLAQSNSDINSLSISPNGIIAGGGSNNIIKLWHYDGTLIRTINLDTVANNPSLQQRRDNTTITSISFSPDGKIIVSGNSDGVINLGTQNGTLIKTLTPNNGAITQISFSPDGNKFAVSDVGGQVNVWQIDGRLIASLTGHKSRVTSVSFSADSKVLASSGSDGTVNLWKCDTPTESLRDRNCTLMFSIDYGSELTSIKFSPTKQTLVAGSSNGSVMIWNLDIDSLLAQGCTWLEDYLLSHPQAARNLSACH
ncbi:WD40 repeat-containing protein [Crinalium epipsammum PCC 9333]|uniref:WD40 repeat-containing protein n=1 Tax=Crinalium epipsammum PCC 9333 TaxID=1173022 RepID=K9W375_9CYAN|nr:AAA-like domain-containing protein [Crinalium epipsammum]AFZ14813.1 WD40 repeat-containing protein [Crinalium epipsammum PCC 9333]